MYNLHLEGLSLDDRERILYPLKNETLEDFDTMEGIKFMMDNWNWEIDEMLGDDK